MLNRFSDTFDFNHVKKSYYLHVIGLFLTSTFLLYVGVKSSHSVDRQDIAAVPLAEPKVMQKTYTLEAAKKIDQTGLLEVLAQTLEKYPPTENLKNYKIILHKTSVEIQFGAATLFAPGRENFVLNTRAEIQQFVAQLKFHKNDLRVRIEAYTDDSPIIKNAHRFANNGLLAKARAESVAGVFIDEKFERDQIVTIGMGEQSPLKPNRDINGKAIRENQLANRRVVLILSNK